jgi:flagellin
MTISIQGSSAAVLTTLDPLAQQSGLAAGAAAAANPAADSLESSSSFIDLSGLSSSALAGPSASAASSASIADRAIASGSIIEGLISQMRDAAVSASDPSLSSDARAALNAGFQSGLSQIQAAVSAAGVDGVNLIDGSASSQTSGGLATYDFSPGGPVIGVPANASLSDPAAAASLADQLQTALGNVGHAVGTLTDQADAMQGDFAGLIGAGSAGVDPSLDADGARLAALQVQQQLSAGSGAIGNQGTASILALFR